MDLIRNLNEALQWYQKGYSITNNPESIKVEYEHNEVVASLGTIDEDAYQLTMYFYNDGTLNRIFINCGGDSIETRDQEIADDLLHMNGDFIDFIYDSIARLEKIEEERYRKQKQSKVSLNPLD